MFKKITSLFTLAAFLSYISFADLTAQVKNSEDLKTHPPTFEEIYKNYSFIETATLSEVVQYPEESIKAEIKKLDDKQKAEREQAKEEHKKAKAELKDKQKQLKDVSDQMQKIEAKYKSEEILTQNNKPQKVTKLDQEGLDKDKNYQTLKENKKKLECDVREAQLRADDKIYDSKQEKIGIYYDVLKTQLDLLRNWPTQAKEIKEQIASGRSENRRFANPENIGLRDLGVGNPADDLKYLENPEVKKFVEEVKRQEYKNPKIRSYIIGLAKTVIDNSDLKIPIQDKNIIVSSEDDINAMAIVGGIVVVNRGLLREVENEAQLVGVLSHEISHLAARHAHRLDKKANAAEILFGLAEVAALIITGGTVGMLGYYLLNYGFQGLGMLISLKLLGVSREYELEADILGMQYVHKMGYDPMSFMGFFEKMGRDKGYVRQTSFFRTHPAFAERIVNTFKESYFLTPREDYLINSDAFLEMQARICVDDEITKAEEKERKDKQYKPTLRRKEKQDEAKIEDRCGLQKPAEEHKNTACNNPAVEDFKAKIREEVQKEKDKEEKGGVEFKRARPERPQ